MVEMIMPYDDELVQLALDSLYGLHDGVEAPLVRARLATPEGQQALRAAERIRVLLQSAATMPFPDVRFLPPHPTVAPAPRSSYRWVGWVVAATVLTALAIPAVAELLAERRLARIAAVAADEVARRRDAAMAKVEQWKSQSARAFAGRPRAATDLDADQRVPTDELAVARREALGKQLNVVLSGPAAISPDAVNYYQIDTQDGAGRAVDAEVSARVIDQANRVLFQAPTAPTRGKYRLAVPAEIPHKSDTKLMLEVEAKSATGAASGVKQQLPLVTSQYLAHLTTDKPMYRPGETVRYRALLLDRFQLQPPAEDLTLTVSLLDSKGAELSTKTGLGKLQGLPGDWTRGLAAGEFVLGPSAGGGEYAVRLREASGRAPEQIRRFIVNAYQLAAFQKELEFTQRSFGPGDEVIAACKASSVRGPLANQPVVASAQVDGQPLVVEHAKSTDNQGSVRLKFRLPKEVARGDASVRVQFTDGATSESLEKPIPVLLNAVAVQFFPEGGDLVVGVSNRVYVQVSTPAGRPAELRGRVLNDRGETVATVQTLHDDREPGLNQGQAVFSIIPSLGQTYRLTVDNPTGIARQFTLPPAKPSGVVLNTGHGVTSDTDALMVQLANVGPERTLIVGAYARGRLLAHERFVAAANELCKVNLQPAARLGGITRVTVFEEHNQGAVRQLTPVAERLVFRKPTKKLELTAAANKLTYGPGDKVSLKLSAKDERGSPVPALAMLGVVNNSVVVMADEKTFHSMPTHFLLTSEVEKAEDLEHTDVLLGAHPFAETALDLLLGVQGWRRFAESGAAMPPAVERLSDATLFARSSQSPIDTSAVRSMLREPAKTRTVEQPRQTRQATESKDAELRKPPAGLAREVQEARSASVAAQAAQSQLSERQIRVRSIGRQVLPWLGGVGLVFGLCLSFVQLLRGKRLSLGACGFMLLAAMSGLGWHLCGQALESIGTNVVKSSVADAGSDEGRLFENMWRELEPNVALREPAKETELADDAKGRFLEELDVFGKEKRSRQLGRGDGEEAVKAGIMENRPMATAQAKAESSPPPPAGTPAAPPAPAGFAGGGPAKDADRAAGAASHFGGVVAPPKLRVAKPEVRTQDDKAAKDSADRPAGGARGASLPPAAQPSAPSEKPPASRAVAPVTAPQPGGSKKDKLDSGEVNGAAPGSRSHDEALFRAPFAIRQYAHVNLRKSGATRGDHAETMFWHPALLIPGEGAEVSFELADEVARYQVLMSAHTLDGRLGALKSEIIAPKLPGVKP